MKRDAYVPYNFNFKYEYQIYKNIGIESEIQHRAKKNIFYKLRLKIRKLFNRNEKKYKNFATFSQWEEHVKEVIKNIINDDKKLYKNFLHYLEYQRRYFQYTKSIITGIAVPAYMVLVAGALTIFGLDDSYKENVQDILIIKGFNWFMLALILLSAIAVLHILITRYTKRYYFYSDYQKVIKKNKKYILSAIK